MTAGASGGYVLSLSEMAFLLVIGAVLGWFLIGMAMRFVRRLLLRLGVGHLVLGGAGIFGLDALLDVDVVGTVLNLLPVL